MVEFDLEVAKGRLHAAGYVVKARMDAFADCLVVRGAERWIGRGVTEADALSDALGKMFPSTLGELFGAVEMRRAHGPLVADAGPPPPAQATALAPPPPAPQPQAEELAPPPPAPPAQATAQATALAPAPQPQADELAVLAAEIDEQAPVVARLPLEMQRAHLIVWAARARSISDASGDVAVARRGSAVVRRIGELHKEWWVGVIKAIQATAAPDDVVDGAVTWADVERSAREGLGALLADARARGMHIDGWADQPDEAVSDPERVFDAAVKVIASSGHLNARADEAEVRLVADAVWKLRSVRGGIRDGLAWGAAVGRVRRMTHGLGRHGRWLRDALDPEQTGADKTSPSAPPSSGVRGRGAEGSAGCKQDLPTSDPS
jgi:hypothetical protein